MNFLELLFRAERRASYARAIGNEADRRARLAPEPDAVYRGVRDELVGKRGGLVFGTLPDGSPVTLPRDIALRSSIVSGATGSGKTRFLLADLFAEFDRLFAVSSSGPGVEIELVDPKRETFDLFAQHAAALWLASGEETRERIANAIRVIDWSREAVAPMAPFDNSSGEVSNAYLAFIRTDVAVQASPQSFSESLRQAYFMLNRVLVELRFPPNYAFAARFLTDAPYRSRVVARIADPDVRAYFENLDHAMPRQTREALLRRIQADLAFEEIRLSTGIPPADLDELLPRRSAPVVIGNYGCSLALPLAKAKERASYRLIDVLMAAPRRSPARPALVVIDEAPMLLSGSSELAEPLMEGARTLRSVGMALTFAAQDFSHTLPTAVVRTLQLNTRWWAIFQSREDGEWIYPHAVPSREERAMSERDRHRAFSRRVAGLRPQHYFLYVKGYPALPLRARDVPDPAAETRRSPEDLREVFRREIASHSLVPATVAAERIARWEAATVHGEDVAAPVERKKAKPPASGLRQLVRQFETDGDDDE